MSSPTHDNNTNLLFTRALPAFTRRPQLVCICLDVSQPRATTLFGTYNLKGPHSVWKFSTAGVLTTVASNTAHKTVAQRFANLPNFNNCFMMIRDRTDRNTRLDLDEGKLLWDTQYILKSQASSLFIFGYIRFKIIEVLMERREISGHDLDLIIDQYPADTPVHLVEEEENPGSLPSMVGVQQMLPLETSEASNVSWEKTTQEEKLSSNNVI
eukprot:Gb_20809 [translate_table: standard]